MSITPKCILLVHGYIREQEDIYKLYQIIPDLVVNVITSFYPKLMKFCDYNKHDFWELSDGKTIQGIKDDHDLNYLLIHPRLLEENGYNKGIHLWSVKNISTEAYDSYLQISRDIKYVGIQRISKVIDTKQPKHTNIDRTDPYCIANNQANIQWIDGNKRTYKITKSAILYSIRIYIDIPFDVDDEFKGLTQKLNCLRPYNHFDSISDDQMNKIQDLQNKCLFLWTRYWCYKCIEQRVAIPSFLSDEREYQQYFGYIMNEYMNKNVNDDEYMFIEFKNKLMDIPFDSEFNWLDYGYPIHRQTKDRVVTVKLNCNQWKVSFYVDNICEKTIAIKSNESYCFGVETTNSKMARITVVDDTLFHQLQFKTFE